MEKSSCPIVLIVAVSLVSVFNVLSFYTSSAKLKRFLLQFLFYSQLAL